MSVKAFILLVCLLAPFQSQDWEVRFDGREPGTLAHLFASSVNLATTQTDPVSTNLNLTLTYEQTISDGVFSASQNLYIATNIMQFTISSAIADKYLRVVSTTVSADRTKFSIQVSNQSPDPGIAATQYTLLRMGFIIIGSQFSGQPDSTPSSFIYAKNDNLVLVDPAMQVGIFNFAAGTTSPFDYAPNSNLGSGCGSVFKDGKIILQTGGCQYYRFFVYVTGFHYVSANAGDNDLDVSAILTRNQVNPANNYEDLQVGTPDQIFKSTSTSTDFGLRLTYTTQNNVNAIIKGVQPSFVFVGIRSWSVANYDNQEATKSDDFVHFGGSSQVGFTHRNLLFGASDSSIYTNLFDKFAHAFCGFAKFQVAAGAALAPSLISQFDSIETGGAGTGVLQNNYAGAAGASGNTAGNDAFFTCSLFGAKNLCDSDAMIVPLVTTGDAERITIEDSLGTNGSGDKRVQAVTNVEGTIIDIVNVLPLFSPTTKFRLDLQADDNTVKITLNFNKTVNSVSRSAFEGIIAFHTNAVAANNALAVGDSIKVIVFGKTVIDETITSTSLSEYDSGKRFQVYSADATETSVIIMFSGTRVADSFVEHLELGLRSYERLINGADCAIACSEKANSDIGIIVDSDIPVCVFCDLTTNERFNPDQSRGDNEQCICQINFYRDADGVCQRCADSLCGECSNLGQDCDACVSNADNGGAGNCTCNSGFFKSATQIAVCQQCNIACENCDSATSCTACKESNSTREPANKGCVCKVGFYDIGQLVCSVCNQECLTCSETASNCVTCDTAGNFVKKDSTCVCADGFYILRTDTDVTCQACDSTCKKCQESSLKCTQCDKENDFRVLGTNNDCVCMDGFLDLLGECMDTTCRDIDPNCQSCAFNPQTKEKECLTCGDNRIVQNGVCKCKVGYYEGPDSTCLPCGSGCSLCGVVSDQLRCFQCAINFENKNEDGTCTCPANSVLVEAAGSLYCKPCSNKCLTCEDKFDFCTSCNPPSQLEEATGECKCPDGMYLSVNGKCLDCMANCDLCDDGFSCDKCATLYAWDGTKCSLNCPRGTYKNGETCTDCSEGCEDCINGYTCIVCKNGYHLFLGSCKDKCPAGTFAHSDGNCYSCVHPCKTCSGPGEDMCDSCVSGYVYFNHQCKTDCDDGTYFADGSCLVCSSRCKTCSGTSSYCTSCHGTQYLFKNTCHDTCPAAIVNGECTDNCPDGNYLHGNVCKKCSDKCETCKDTASNCLRCSSGYKSYKGECMQNCPSNTLDQGTFCVDCDVTCNGCSGSTFQCINCAAGYVKAGLICIAGCFDGQYLDTNTGECEFCGEGCKVCSSPTNCNTCYNPIHVPVNGVCQRACPPGAKLVGDKCVCTFGVEHLGACVSSCPEGYWSSNGVCQICQFPCKACYLAADNCLSCREGYVIDTETDPRKRGCKRENSCPYGQALVSGTCRNRCSQGFYYKTGCVPACPYGFSNNGFGGCIEDTNPTICPPKQYQQGTECVNTCSVRYYPNQSTRVCERCIAHCLVCVNGESCVRCMDGKVEIDGKCVDSLGCLDYQVQYNGQCLDGCPVGTARQGKTCTRACKYGSYYRFPYCYSSCPTDYRTPEACVESCGNYSNCVPA